MQLALFTAKKTSIGYLYKYGGGEEIIPQIAKAKLEAWVHHGGGDDDDVLHYTSKSVKKQATELNTAQPSRGA
jgi:hypothetical protein